MMTEGEVKERLKITFYSDVNKAVSEDASIAMYIKGYRDALKVVLGVKE